MATSFGPIQSSSAENVFKQQSLSRNTLYAPIEKYISNGPSTIQNDHNNSHTQRTTLTSTTVTTRNLDKKLREKNLYTFLEKISSEYHNASTSSLFGIHNNGDSHGGGGNHGSRTKNAVHFQKDLERRALTLIGGGIGNSFAPSTASMVDDSTGGAASVDVTSSSVTRQRRRRKGRNRLVHGAVSRRERKRRCRSVTGVREGGESLSLVDLERQSRRDGGRDSSECVSAIKVGRIPPVGNHKTTDILVGLNNLWNSYVNSLLRNYLPANSQTIRPDIITRLISSAELVGACVKVARCESHTSYRGMSGFIVDITTNTWRVAVLPKGVVWEIEEESAKDLKLRCGNKRWKVVTVPKRKSTLILWLALTTKEQTSNVQEYCRIEISGNL